MKLTLLGIYGPFPAPNGGCSSYLVEDGKTRILLDCGSGSLSRLRSLTPKQLHLDAIILSHMHADHCGEIDLYRYMLEFGQMKAPLKVFSPETDRLQYPVFDAVQTYGGMQTAIGSLELEFTAMQHAVPTLGMRITDADGNSLFYTGDTGWFDGLVDAVQDADLLLADACLADESNPKFLKSHMTLGQVAKLRKDANCKRAILTHRFGSAPGLLPLSDPQCEHAVEGAVYEI